MSEHEITYQPFSKIGLTMVAHPAPGLSENDLHRKLKQLGNPILDRDSGGFLIVDQEEDIAVPGELVWKCDHCPAIFRTRPEAVEHEKQHEKD